MPKATVIAIWTDAEGKSHAPGEEVEMSDEEYQEGRARGAVASVDEPYQGEAGHYSDVTTRTDVQGEAVPVEAPEPINAPQEDEPDEMPHRASQPKSKK